MKAKHSHILFILDRSGSMQDHKEPTIAGFNKFLAEQQAEAGTCNVSLLQFDYAFKHEYVVRNADIQTVKPLNDTTFVPRGGTALVDAIGHGIDDLGRDLAAMPEAGRPEKVYVVILTDGEENASREYDMTVVPPLVLQQSTYLDMLQQAQQQYAIGQGYVPTPRKPKGIVAEMIQHQREKYGWQFIFIGATEDAIQSAIKMNIGVGQTMSYTPSSAVANLHTYSSLSQQMTNSRVAPVNSQSATMSWTEQDRKGAVEPDAK